MELTRLWLIRHGAVDRTRAAGQRHDPDLTDRGRAQVAGLRRRLALPDRTVRLRSPARRSHTTAHLLGWDDATVEPAWAERDLGTWEGRLWQELWPQAPEAVQHDPAAFAAFTPPDGEPVVDLHRRVRGALQALPGVDVAIVTHAGPIVATLAAALDLSPVVALRLQVGTATVTRLVRYGDELTVEAVGA